MGDKNAIEKEIKKNKIIILICSVVECILVLFEIYVMFGYPYGYLPAMILGIAIVAVLAFLVKTIMDLNEYTRGRELLEYAGIYKAQKANYLITKKSFEDIAAQMSIIGNNSSIPADEIISAQKAVAKVTINRSKENTDALMNSNDELINQLLEFQDKLASNNEDLMKAQGEMLDKTKEEILAKNNALEEKVASLSAALEELQKNGVKAEVPVNNVAEPIAQPAQAVEPEPIEEAEPEVAPESIIESEPDVAPESIAEPEPEPEPESIVESEPEVAPEPIIESAPEVAPEPEPEPVAEPEPVGEPELEPEPAVEEEFDPNKIMSPDDIAALLAAAESAQAGVDTPTEPVAEPEPVQEPEPIVEAEPEVAPEPEPVAEPEAVAEPAPAVDISSLDIDTSDPNKVMSADEIAALFNNL